MNSDFLSRRGKNQKTNTNTHKWERPATFRTPDEVAAEEDDLVPAAQAAGSSSPHNTPPKKSFKERLKSLSKKQWAIIITAAVVVLAGSSVGAYYLWFHDAAKPVVKKAVIKQPVAKTPAAIPITSTLTGLPLADASTNNLPVTAIMVENSVDARPQFGLNEAGVVFEAEAEGGITRLLTLWQDTAPDSVCPVRSVRPYYLQWLQGFDAPVAHVGGSADALKLIKDWHIKDLDQFHNSGPYWRISSRFAPHNMCTSVKKLHDLEAQKGFGKSTYTPLARKPAATPSASVTARTIDFTISGALYNSHYDYNQATNSYLRSEGGKPHMDANTGQQIDPKVVIGLVMKEGKNGIYTTYETLGSGQAYIFQDGGVTVGTWTKVSNTSQFTFKDAGGAEIKLNPGRTWLTAVGSTSRVSYKP